MNCWRRPLTCHSSDIFTGVLPSLNTSDLTVTLFLIKITGMSSPCLCEKLHFLFSSPSFSTSLRSYFVVCTVITLRTQRSFVTRGNVKGHFLLVREGFSFT